MKWSARSDLHAQGCLILSQVGLLFPVNHAPENGVPDRLRSGDLLHERQACCLDYTTGTEMERVNGIAPLSRPWHGRILLLNHTRRNWCPSRILTDNLALRTRLLCV